MLFRGRTVAFHTLGCKLNFSESSALARLMYDQGFEKRTFGEAADVYVINTCSVTENADRECRSIVRSALAANPDAFVAVVGCYAQLKPQEIASIEGVDVVLGAAEKFRLLNYINLSGKNRRGEVHSCEIAEVNSFSGAFSLGDRTRSFLKIQDGCDYSCTFCTIPLARGASRSDTIEGVLKNVQKIAASGVKEVVLTGVNTGDFGKNEKAEGRRRSEDFFALVKELDKEQGIKRFRISSIEPNLLQDEIIQFVADSERFMPHFHIPLQSGSNVMLAAMKRRYRRELYAERVKLIKQLMPHCAIGVDVIVGFPGETEEHFLETYRFLNELPVSYLHVFTYSERQNTEAASMTGVVPVAERKRRNKMLRILSAKKLRAFYESQLGQERLVLFETENKDGFLYGYTDNYIRVKIPFDTSLCNSLHPVELGSFDVAGDMLGKLAPVSLQAVQ